MTIYEIISKKRRGEKLSADEILFITEGFTRGDVPDVQMAAFLMAVCINGMDFEETMQLTGAMMYSGDVYDLDKEIGLCADKHSTGGVGDKTTLVVAAVCASCGVYVPKMSGRGLGFTGGTIDKLESIPGYRTELSHEEFIGIVKKAGFAVTSQSGHLVPADKKMYALRDITATVDSIPLICSSIMSKKLATGAGRLVLDVKCGSGAFMKNADDARELARFMLETARRMGRKCTCVITDMDKPLGRTAGNGIEVAEALQLLKGEIRPGADGLYQVCMELAARMLMLCGKGTRDECVALAENAISTGAAYEAFCQNVSLQGGDVHALEDYSLLYSPKKTLLIRADRSGFISRIDCEKAGLCAVSLGAGRQRKGDAVDHSSGIHFVKTVGEYTDKGDIIAEIMTSTPSCDTDDAAHMISSAYHITEEEPERIPPVIYTMDTV